MANQYGIYRRRRQRKNLMHRTLMEPWYNMGGFRTKLFGRLSEMVGPRFSAQIEAYQKERRSVELWVSKAEDAVIERGTA